MSQKIHATIPWRVGLYIDTDPHIVFDSELSGHGQEIAALADPIPLPLPRSHGHSKSWINKSCSRFLGTLHNG